MRGTSEANNRESHLNNSNLIIPDETSLSSRFAFFRVGREGGERKINCWIA